jgi:hypothetical protein
MTIHDFYFIIGQADTIVVDNARSPITPLSESLPRMPALALHEKPKKRKSLLRPKQDTKDITVNSFSASYQDRWGIHPQKIHSNIMMDYGSRTSCVSVFGKTRDTSPRKPIRRSRTITLSLIEESLSLSKLHIEVLLNEND